MSPFLAVGLEQTFLIRPPAPGSTNASGGTASAQPPPRLVMVNNKLINLRCPSKNLSFFFKEKVTWNKFQLCNMWFDVVYCVQLDVGTELRRADHPAGRRRGSAGGRRCRAQSDAGRRRRPRRSTGPGPCPHHLRRFSRRRRRRWPTRPATAAGRSLISLD